MYAPSKSMTTQPKKYCKEQKLLKVLKSIIMGFKNQSLFPRSVLVITVGTLIELCCRRDKFSTNF